MFTWIDYVVFSATLVLSLAIGVFYAVSGNRQRTTSEYLMADRSFGVLPVSVSFTVSFLSSVAILGNSSEMYYHGATYLFYPLGVSIGIILAVFTAVPMLYPLKLTSINEYLSLRYESGVVLFLGWLTQATRQIIYCGIVIYGPAVMFEAMAGFPRWVSILLIGVASTVYTSIGGLKAVIWTDVFQSVVIFGGLFVFIIRGTMLVGGVEAVYSAYNDGYRLSFEIDPSPLARQSVWIMFAAGLSSGYEACGSSQTGLQRFCALRSMKDAKISMILSVFIRVIFELLCSLCGVIAYSYYVTRSCDPLKAGYIESVNEILPHFVADVMGYWGMPGLFVASIFCGSLSTVSSCLNGVAAITWDDVFSKRLHHWTEWKKTSLSKIITLTSGMLALGITALTAIAGGTIMQVTLLLLTAFRSPALVFILAGGCFPRINSRSILFGSVFSMVLGTWLSAGALFHKSYQDTLPTSDLNCTNYGFNTVYKISPYLMCVFVPAVSIIAALLTSFLPGCYTIRQKKMPHLYFPFIGNRMQQRPDPSQEYKMVDLHPQEASSATVHTTNKADL